MRNNNYIENGLDYSFRFSRRLWPWPASNAALHDDAAADASGARLPPPQSITGAALSAVLRLDERFHLRRDAQLDQNSPAVRQ